MASELHWDMNCKFGSVAYPGHPDKLTELHLWRFKLEILQSRLPCRHPKTWHSDADISDFGFFLMLLFFSKNNNPKTKTVGYTRTLYLQTGKNTVSWNFYLVFIIDFLKLYTGIIWHSYFPLHGIS